MRGNTNLSCKPWRTACRTIRLSVKQQPVWGHIPQRRWLNGLLLGSRQPNQLTNHALSTSSTITFWFQTGKNKNKDKTRLVGEKSVKQKTGKRAASWHGMEEANNVNKQQNAASCAPLPAPSHTISPLPLWEGERGRRGRRKSLPPGPLLVSVC